MLDIIKASAGSGKTFQLAYDYIKLLLGEKIKPSNYSGPSEPAPNYRLAKTGNANHRSILAVTFTNKATDEMKARILHELAVLAGMVKGWEKESDYLDDLCNDLHCRAEQIKEAASMALRRILYDYDSFQVSTIDSFFQMVLRSFAREVNLSGNYELELRDNEAIEWAVGQYLDSLRKNPDSQRTRDNVEWITDFLLERLRDGKAVNLFNRNSELFQYLVKFIKNVSNETYMLNKEDMSRYFADSDNIRNLRKHLNMANKAVLRHISDTGKEAIDYIGQRKGIKAFKLSKTAEKMFLKAVDIEKGLASLATSKTLLNAIDNPDSLFNSGNTDSEAVDFLGECCQRIVRYISQHQLIKAISSRAFYMGIIGEVNGFIEQFRKENNTLLISDTNSLLNEIMEGSDAPFIYERVGVRLRHFLIDEFQDTSKMQWKNLRPLILNGLSELNDSLIIGDEKQCIYRFRNSDPTLLQSAVQKEFHDSIDLGKIENAKNNNWRSSLEVIEFNNALFDPASSAMSREFGSIYAKARQNIPEKKKPRRGYVSVTAVSGLKERKLLKKACFENMARNIERQVSAGYEPCEIAVLARTRDTASDIISYLQNFFNFHSNPDINRMRVVSDDALTVGKSAAVRNIVSRLRYYAMPSEQFSNADDSSLASGRKSWRDVMTMLNRFEFNVDSNMSASEALRNALLYFNEIPDFTDGLDDSAPYSLQSLVAQIAGRLPEKVRVQENLFISAFQDLVAEYCSKYDPDIHSFLRWWDSSGATSIVGSPPDRNAVRVMTIHKSKGLEFKCVHVPDASWSFTGKSSLEWFDTACLKEMFPIELPPIYPLELGSWMSSTPLARQFHNRMSEKRMDEFNVLYVTLTRAIDELIISYPSTGKGDKGIITTGDFLNLVPGMLDAAGVDYTLTRTTATEASAGDDPTADMTNQCKFSTVTVGMPTEHAEPDKKDTPKTLDPQTRRDMPDFNSLPRTDLWKDIRLDKDINTIEAPDVDDSTSSIPEQCTMQEVMRHILASVYSRDHLHKSAMRLVRKGAIDAATAGDAEEILTRQIESDSRILRWFEGYMRVRPRMSYNVMYHDEPRLLPWVRVIWYDDGSVDAIYCQATPKSEGFPLKAVKKFLSDSGYQSVRCYVWNLNDGSVTEIY